MQKAITAAVFALLSTHASLATAEEETPTRTIYIHGEAADANRARTYAVDTAIPVVPAFALLSADAPQSIGASFGGDTYFNIAGNGGGIPEIGAAARPYWLFRDDTLDEYRNAGPLRRIAARTIVSGAVATIPGDTERAGAAIGISTTLLDGSDPRQDRAFDGCVTNVLIGAQAANVTPADVDRIVGALKQRGLLTRANGDDHTQLEALIRRNLSVADVDRLAVHNLVSSSYDALAQEAARTDVSEAARLVRLRDGARPVVQAELTRTRTFEEGPLNEAYDECVTQASARFLQHDDFTIGAGTFWRGDDDQTFDGLSHGGTSLWIGYRRPFLARFRNDDGTIGADDSGPAANGQRVIGTLNLYARYEQREEQEFPNDVVSDSQTSVAFASYSIEGEEGDWRATLAGSWNHREYGDDALEDREFTRISASVEHRLPSLDGAWNNAWVEIGYGALSEELPDESSYGFVRLKLDMTRR